MAIGVLILIALLLMWLTDAMATGDTDVNAPAPSELALFANNVYIA